ncbi:MAG: Cation efflux system protein CusC precursor [Syntrophorhabdaceae bacterium PtaU1.Bin034]|nr:MAG: Cation efflux system protein CusC precursor [Syntrophorhabdaceae bacterium PtaU1.Bin034]
MSYSSDVRPMRKVWGEVSRQEQTFSSLQKEEVRLTDLHKGLNDMMAKLLLAALALISSACVKVGPDFVRPEVAVSQNWLEADDTRIRNDAVEYRNWWRIFNDPVLDRLIDTAYRQNLSLRAAGVRVLEARAQLGIAGGQLYPQTQQAFGSLQYNRVSEYSTFSSFGSTLTTYAQDQIGITASWEIDFWGKFRRNIESADALLIATVADYDAMLVSLTADVASSYISIMTLQKRVDIARQNLEAQQENLKIVEARLQGGTTTQRDLEQAITVLSNTEATIPVLETQLQQAKNALCVLLGLPPGNLTDILKDAKGIPVAPPQIAVGIPADLLRRRPDIRSAEYQAIAQGAQIGVAKADLFPAFSLNGTFDFSAVNIGGARLSDMFRWSSREYALGPAAQWNIFNYGRIANNVRLQDARFQELLITYQNRVLAAQQEVENALVGFLRAQEAARFLVRSATAGKDSLSLSALQYQGGTTDFTTVLTAEQALLSTQDNLVATLGNVSANLVAVYRALGGGWQIREGMDLIPEEVKRTMANRTDWGDLLNQATYMAPTYRERGSAVRLPDW